MTDMHAVPGPAPSARCLWLARIVLPTLLALVVLAGLGDVRAAHAQSPSHLSGHQVLSGQVNSGRGATHGPAVPGETSTSDRRLMLTPSQWRADQQGPTMDEMFPSNGLGMQHPILVWLLILEVLGLAAFPLMFFVLRNLPDRGYLIAKTVGLLIAGYVSWILVRAGVATFDRQLLLVVAGLHVVLGFVLAALQRGAIIEFAKTRWRYVLCGELVFLAGFALFVLLRMWYPDLGHQFAPVSPTNLGDGRMGEKQTELAYLSAIVRSRVFPPYDPFFAGGYINYYYYGFFLVGLLCKLSQIVPAVGFNLAIATFFAMLVANTFSVGLALTRRLSVGIVAAGFVGLLGNLNGGWQVITGLMSVSTTHSDFPFLGGVANVMSGLQQAIVNHQALPAFDYWGPTRIIPPVGGPITEFPYFTYLFADLHPHLIAYPITVAALALATNAALALRETRIQTAVIAVVGALIAGALAVTNPWDYPTYLVVLGLGGLVGLYTSRRLTSPRALLPVAGRLVAIIVISALLYLPFKLDYKTVFVTGIGLVRDVTPQMLQSGGLTPNQFHDAVVTPLGIYLEHFGFFVFAVLSYLVLLLFSDAGLGRRLRRMFTVGRFFLYYRDRFPRVWRAAGVVRRLRRPPETIVDGSMLVGFIILVVGLAILQFYLLAILAACLGLVVLLLPRLGRALQPAEIFVLALVTVPLVLSVATQVVFVKDWLAGGSDFRMNTIFKFYNQMWVLYATCAATGLYWFVERQTRSEAGSEVETSMSETAPQTLDTPRPTLAVGIAHGRPRSQWRVRERLMRYASELRHQQTHWAGPRAKRYPVRPLHSQLARIDRGSVFAVVGWDGLPALSSEPTTSGGENQEDVPAATRSPKRRSRIRTLLERRPYWVGALLLLLAGSATYTYAGTVSRETVRSNWLPEKSVPRTLDGMAFMKVAYPGDYAGIQWLNGHVHGAKVIAEAGNAYYDWRSRVSMFTGLPDIMNGIHEGEQRFGDELDRGNDVSSLYDSPSINTAWSIIHSYRVRYIFDGFSEQQCAQYQCFSHAGLAKFGKMVGHGLRVAFQRPGITIYEVRSA